MLGYYRATKHWTTEVKPGEVVSNETHRRLSTQTVQNRTGLVQAGPRSRRERVKG